MALSTSRMLVFRGRPPRLAGGISGSILFHWASVRSVGYGWRSIPQLYRLCHFSDRLSGLWTVSRHGGVANRITPLKGVVGDPFFSPDGKLVAFSANYCGYNNVYVVPDSGGEPRRLTAHPSSETVVGWTPDSKFVIFSSKMLSDTDHPRLFKASVDGGYPTALPLPTGTEASFSPDGTHLAYVPIFHRQTAWKRYRGGQAS